MIEYTVGPEGIAAGGAIYVMPEPFWGWSTPQNVDPARLGYTEVEGLSSPPQRSALLVATVEERALEPGEVVRIKYGAGSGARVDLYAERGARIWLSVDGDGDGIRGVVEDSPRVDVLHRAATRVVAHLPGRVRPGDAVRLSMAVLDEAGNLVESARGTFTARGQEVTLTEEDRGACTLEWTAEEPGLQRIEVDYSGPEGEFETLTNPLEVRADLPPLLWADLHGHSQLSDGTGQVEDYLRYARDVAGLDVVALTDHDHFGVRFLDSRPDLWDGIRDRTMAFHEPGRFVALLGFEWTSWIHGHRHVLYFDDEGEPLSSLHPDTQTPAGLWDALRGKPALTLAHHSAGDPVPVNWSFPPDPELEPVTEIMSVHGSSEAADSPSVLRGGRRGNFVRDVLDDGYQLGFVGSGDSHDGHPGLPHLNPMYGFRPGREIGQGGVAAIMAERTRMAVLEALRARRCYATSGARLLLEVSLGGAPGGGELAPASNALLELDVHGTSAIARIDLIRSGAVVRSWEGSGEWSVAVRQELMNLEAGDYVYVRVVQQDGGLAWSSPIFVRS